MLDYATASDGLDENLMMSLRVVRESLHQFCINVIGLYCP